MDFPGSNLPRRIERLFHPGGFGGREQPELGQIAVHDGLGGGISWRVRALGNPKTAGN